MSDCWTDRLSEYIDEELPTAERVELEAHLADCDDCRTLVADLRAVIARAAALTPTEPPADLWPGIRDRIGGDVRVIPLPDAASGRARRLSISIPQLAAAAAIVAFLSGGGVWLALRGPAAEPEPAFAVDVDAGAQPESTIVSFAGTREYDAAIAQLERELADARSRLDPATVAVVEHNLDVIDAAIAEARRALADDPANPYLNRHLDNTLMTKIEVLRRVTGLGRGRT